jgi:uncharacterized protein (DUF983 family)
MNTSASFLVAQTARWASPGMMPATRRRVAAIFILGAGVVALAIGFEFRYQPPMWVHVAIWPVVILAATLAIMRPLKGIAVALQYHFRSVDGPERPGGA